jgi:beta-glucosidase
MSPSIFPSQACRAIAAAGAVLLGGQVFGTEAIPARGTYLDSNWPIEQRVEDLLGRMTLEEKVGQMCQYLGAPAVPKDGNKVAAADDETAPSSYAGLRRADLLQMVRAGRIGSFLSMYANAASLGNDYQQAAAESRLAIPLLMGVDAIHGHAMCLGATVFPVPIGLAATFDTSLVERTAQATAREMRATGAQWAFAPNVEVVRDQRWGRVNETFGEDPLLVSRMGVATVRGLQGDLSNPEMQVLACAKHLLGGSQPVGGLNHAPAELSERTIREVFLPPFQACIEAGVFSVMVAHNEVNGVPSHSNARLLSGTLKKELGFHGLVVSDWLDVSRLWSIQHVARNMSEASELAVRAGLDMHMHGPGFYEAVLSAVQAGRVAPARIDDAVRRILRAKFAVGLFEHRFTDPEWQKHVGSPENWQLALEAARKSIVLLRNQGGLLPLRKDVARVFLTGPNAADASALGDWAAKGNADRLVTVKAGLEHYLPDGRLDYFDCGSYDTLTTTGIEAAADRARGASVAVLVVGGHPLLRGGSPGQATEGENVDRADLELPGRQLDLIKAVQATGVPTVVVLFNGGAISSPWTARNTPAILEAFYPGHQGGRAVAEILFGEVNPSGRMPYTVPQGVGFLPSYYYQRPGSTAPLGRYAPLTVEESKKPLFPFGFGLSYTTFAYSNLRVPARVSVGQDIRVDIDVKNAGNMPGDEVVMMFLSDLLSSVTVPVKLLKDFTRVHLEPGETRTVRFLLPAAALALLDADLRPLVEPGDFRLRIGSEEAVFIVVAP